MCYDLSLIFGILSILLISFCKLFPSVGYETETCIVRVSKALSFITHFHLQNGFVDLWMTYHCFSVFSLCQITLKIRVTVTMHLVIVFLLSALLPLSLSTGRDPLAWLHSWSRSYYLGSLQADTKEGACPDVCDCPPSFPVAMYCDGRGLTAMPAIPSHVKYLYLQNNAITAVPDSALINATNLLWLMMHHNQLTSEAIGTKVNLHLFSVASSHISEIEVGCSDVGLNGCQMTGRWLTGCVITKEKLLHVNDQIVNFHVIGNVVLGLKCNKQNVMFNTCTYTSCFDK